MPDLIQRSVNTPLLVAPTIPRALLSRLAARKADIQGPHAATDSGETKASTCDLRYRRTPGISFHNVDGLAVIPMDGVLLHKFGVLDPWYGLTGYDGLERKLTDAAKDRAMRGIAIDMHCYGGEVDGCDRLARVIADVAKVKPVWAIVDESCYSAAYWAASQCSRIYMTPNGGIGSVGVVWMHANFGPMLEEAGVEITLIHAGAHKVDGNPYEALPEDVRAEMQADCDQLRQKFAGAVAAGRGIGIKTVLATEARCLNADEALKIGFVDGVMPSHEIIQAFLDDINGAKAAPRFQPSTLDEDEDPAAEPTHEEEIPMTTAAQQQAAAAAAASQTPPPAHQATQPPPAGPSGPEAVAAFRARVNAIKALPEAKGREAAADNIALNTDMSVDQAKSLLATLPAAQATTNQSPLEAAMRGVRNADLGASAGGGDPNQESKTYKAEDLDPNVIYARFNNAHKAVAG